MKNNTQLQFLFPLCFLKRLIKQTFNMGKKTKELLKERSPKEPLENYDSTFTRINANQDINNPDNFPIDSNYEISFMEPVLSKFPFKNQRTRQAITDEFPAEEFTGEFPQAFAPYEETLALNPPEGTNSEGKSSVEMALMNKTGNFEYGNYPNGVNYANGVDYVDYMKNAGKASNASNADNANGNYSKTTLRILNFLKVQRWFVFSASVIFLVFMVFLILFGNNSSHQNPLPVANKEYEDSIQELKNSLAALKEKLHVSDEEQRIRKTTTIPTTVTPPESRVVGKMDPYYGKFLFEGNFPTHLSLPPLDSIKNYMAITVESFPVINVIYRRLNGTFISTNPITVPDITTKISMNSYRKICKFRGNYYFSDMSGLVVYKGFGYNCHCVSNTNAKHNSNIEYFLSDDGVTYLRCEARTVDKMYVVGPPSNIQRYRKRPIKRTCSSKGRIYNDGEVVDLGTNHYEDCVCLNRNIICERHFTPLDNQASCFVYYMDEGYTVSEPICGNHEYVKELKKAKPYDLCIFPFGIITPYNVERRYFQLNDETYYLECQCDIKGRYFCRNLLNNSDDFY